MTAKDLSVVVSGIAPVIREFCSVQIGAAVAPLKSVIERATASYDTDRKAWQEQISTLEQRLIAAEQRALIPGPQGEKGMDGAAGPQGEPGKDGAEGPTGATGPKGDPGEPGPAGDRGETGPPGDPGKPGDLGPSGERGPAGADGQPGQDGAAGPQGQMGPQGEKGLDGLNGKDGADGVIPAETLDDYQKRLAQLETFAASWAQQATLKSEDITAHAAHAFRSALGPVIVPKTRMQKRVIRNAAGQIQSVVEEPIAEGL